MVNSTTRVRTFESRPVEYLLAWLCFMNGALLLMPWEMYGNVRGLALFAKFITEAQLGAAWLSVATFKFYSLYANKYARASQTISGAWFVFVGTVSIMAQPYGVWAWHCYFYALINLAIAYRGVRR